jgi:hypothetical protein
MLGVVDVVNAVDEPADPVRLIEQHVRDLLKAEDVFAARKVAEEALRASPSRPELLWLAADVEFAAGDQQAGMCCLAKAVDASGGRGAAAVSKQIQALSDNHLWREALKTVEHIPAQIRGDPLVREAVGDFYKTLCCYGHAVVGYGDSSGLPPAVRRLRLVSWLRSGGPFRFVRHRINAWEDSSLLSDLREGQPLSAQLDAVPDLDSQQAHRLKVSWENSDYEWSYQIKFWSGIFRWLLRLLPAAFLPVWLVLYAIVKTVNFMSGPPGAVGGTAISAAVALGIAILLARSQLRSDLTLRGILSPTLGLFVFLCTAAILSEIAVAEGYDHQALPTTGWWAWVVFGVMVLPAVCAAMVISAATLTVIAVRRIEGVQRRNCQVVLLGALFSILRDMQSPAKQLDLQERLEWSWRLEWIARRISRDLLPSYSLNYLASRDWLKQRAAGWAEALRHMQREIIASIPGERAKVEAKLRREVRCLATGDLGALAWRQPPASPSRRTTLARRTIEILRTVLVAALPLCVVLVGQAVLHFSAEAFRWASITTGIWALLYVVISLDPTIRDKIDTARGLAETLHETRRGG